MYSQANSWSSPHHFDSRAFFRTSSTPAELVIDKLRETDAGIYRCRVDFRNSPTRNQKVNLTIIGEFDFLFFFFGTKTKQGRSGLINSRSGDRVPEENRFSGRLFITTFPQLLTTD